MNPIQQWVINNPIVTFIAAAILFYFMCVASGLANGVDWAKLKARMSRKTALKAVAFAVILTVLILGFYWLWVWWQSAKLGTASGWMRVVMWTILIVGIIGLLNRWGAFAKIKSAHWYTTMTPVQKKAFWKRAAIVIGVAVAMLIIVLLWSSIAAWFAALISGASWSMATRWIVWTLVALAIVGIAWILVVKAKTNKNWKWVGWTLAGLLVAILLFILWSDIVAAFAVAVSGIPWDTTTKVIIWTLIALAVIGLVIALCKATPNANGKKSYLWSGILGAALLAVLIAAFWPEITSAVARLVSGVPWDAWATLLVALAIIAVVALAVWVLGLKFIAQCAAAVLLIAFAASMWPTSCSTRSITSGTGTGSVAGGGEILQTVVIPAGERVHVYRESWAGSNQSPVEPGKKAYMYVPTGGKPTYDENGDLIIIDEQVVVLEVGNPTVEPLEWKGQSGVRFFWTDPGTSTTVQIKRTM